MTNPFDHFPRPISNQINAYFTVLFQNVTDWLTLVFGDNSSSDFLGMLIMDSCSLFGGESMPKMLVSESFIQ